VLRARFVFIVFTGLVSFNALDASGAYKCAGCDLLPTLRLMPVEHDLPPPGAKLCMIADAVAPPVTPDDEGSPSSKTNQVGFVVGVDIAQQRLASTRTLLRKYARAHDTH